MSEGPVFIVGSGRSGTTLLYELLSGHPAFAWASNISERFPSNSLLPAVNRLAPPGPSSRNRLPIRPSEAYRAFDWASPRYAGSDSPPLESSHLSNDEGKRLRAFVRRHVQAMGAEQFLNKNTRNTRRIGYLDAAFPNARFLHVVRHPYAVVASMLRVKFWADLALWNVHVDDVSPGNHDTDTQTMLAAALWRDETALARAGGAALPGDRYLEVRYEEVVSSPRAALKDLCEAISISFSARFSHHVSLFGTEDRNRDVDQRLTRRQKNLIANVVRQAARALDYEL